MNLGKISKQLKHGAQLGQDHWVLEFFNYKTKGYFVEIGAYDGIEYSNTYLMESSYDWNGICVEANPLTYNYLISNRKCHISNACIYKESGKTVPFFNTPLLGGIEDYLNKERISKHNLEGDLINLKTLSLNDLLEKFKAPEYIDYISIDTEGSELEIIKNFNFKKYTVNLWTIEHNDEFQSKNQSGEIISFFLSMGYNYKLVEHDIWLFKE